MSHRSSSRLDDGPPSSSRLTSLVSKFSSITLSKKYTSGVSKAPEYKRVAVLPETPNSKFKIDESDVSSPRSPGILSPIRSMFRGASSSKKSSKSSTLPSVLDIRHNTPASSRQNTDAQPNQKTMPTQFPEPGPSDLRYIVERDRQQEAAPRRTYDDDTSTTFTAPRPPPRSDYSLTTNDLMTPITPSDNHTAYAFMAAPPLPTRSPRPDSMVLPEEPEVASPTSVYFSTTQSYTTQQGS